MKGVKGMKGRGAREQVSRGTGEQLKSKARHGMPLRRAYTGEDALLRRVSLCHVLKSVAGAFGSRK